MYGGAFDLADTAKECPSVHLNIKTKAQPDTSGNVGYKIFE